MSLNVWWYKYNQQAEEFSGTETLAGTAEFSFKLYFLEHGQTQINAFAFLDYT